MEVIGMEYKLEELLILVKELTDIYTGKASTSITYEAAQQLMGAVLYCIRENDTGLTEEKEVTGIVDPKGFPTAREAYDYGYRLVVDKIRKTNDIYNEIIRDFRSYGNFAYYDTVIKGLPEFFRWYDPRLNPENHIILLDYTVLERLEALRGVDLIYRYVVCIQLEQEFLKKLPDEYVKAVLITYHPDHEELLINPCGIVLRKILANMLIGVKIEKVKLEASDYEKLAAAVNSTEREQLKQRLLYHLERLIENVYQENQPLYLYLGNEIPNIATEFMNAAKHHVLHNIL